jgi:hypothetical protein
VVNAQNDDVYGPGSVGGNDTLAKSTDKDEKGNKPVFSEKDIQGVIDDYGKSLNDGKGGEVSNEISKGMTEALKGFVGQNKDTIEKSKLMEVGKGVDRGITDATLEKQGFGQFNLQTLGQAGITGGAQLISGDYGGAIGSIGSALTTQGLQGGISKLLSGDELAAFKKTNEDPANAMNAQIGGKIGVVGSGLGRMIGGVKESDRTDSDKAGAAAGGAIGTAAGALIGSAILGPVVGTLVGAAMGGALGDAAGGFIGQAAGGGYEKAKKDAAQKLIDDAAKDQKDYLKKSMDLLKIGQQYQSAQVDYARQAAENAKINARYIQATGQTFKSAGELVQQDMSFISAGNLLSGRYADIPNLGKEASALGVNANSAKMNTEGFDSGLKGKNNYAVLSLDGQNPIGHDGPINVPVQLTSTGGIKGAPTGIDVAANIYAANTLPKQSVQVDINAKYSADSQAGQAMKKGGVSFSDIEKQLHIQSSQNPA